MVKLEGFSEAILAGLINFSIIEAVSLLGVNELTPFSSKWYTNKETDLFAVIALTNRLY
jgi:hypothetical protein